MKPNSLYIDQINNVMEDKIGFKHLGSLKLDSILPHNGPIEDEDFEKWLDMLIYAGEELPETKKLLVRKKKLNRQLLQRKRSIHSKPQNFSNEMFDKKPPPPMMPAYIDISPIILQFYHCNRLLKFPPSDFGDIVTGLCIQVDTTQISHSMKLPPSVNYFPKYLLIPISYVTFDEPNPYELLMNPYLSNVLTKTMNENDGNVLCSSQLLQQKIRMPSPINEQLIQNSLAFWTFNNIPMPTSEQIQRKAAQLRDALMLNYNVKIPAKTKGKYSIILPIGLPPLLRQNNQNQPTNSNNDAKMDLPKGFEGKWNLCETGNGRYLWEWITEKMTKNREKKSKKQRNKQQKKANNVQKGQPEEKKNKLSRRITKQQQANKNKMAKVMKNEKNNRGENAANIPKLAEIKFGPI